ncbi:MAG: glutamate--tRNA ligase [Candidatus Uhrbacteria bacterium]
MSVRTRFAPSPTGFLHVGGLRTALYNYLLARQQTGTYILRIEDTDRERFVPGAVESLLRMFERVNLLPDEGPKLVDGVIAQTGDVGPYIQSERLPIYAQYAKQLLDAGVAYVCFCSSERLDGLRKQQEIAKLSTKYDRHCASLSSEEVLRRLGAGESHVLRLRVPEGETSFEDVIRGTITINNAEVDDQVLIKSDGFPTYHMAVVVDDHLMKITHVIRGEEWISSTPKHVILYRLFGWDAPLFAHLPLLLNPDKSKLSKRQGDVAVEDYLAKGYLPEALVNFVALLGFNPKADQEIYAIDELIELFDLAKINKSGAVFDQAKLNWMNGQYIMKKTASELVALVRPFLDASGKTVDAALLEKICAIEKTRMERLTDIVEIVDAYVSVPAYDPAILVWKKADAADSKANLAGVRDHLAIADESVWNEISMVETSIKAYIEAKGLSNGNVLWPTRVALSGRAASPSPFELAWALGKDETMRRLASAIGLL